MGDEAPAPKKLPWRKDPMREVLRKDIISGYIPANMTAPLAQLKRHEYEKMEGLFSGRLKSMRQMVAKEAAGEKKKKGHKWDKKNPVRKQLQLDISKNVIDANMDPEVARKLRPEYEAITDDALWKSRLQGMRKIVTEGKARAADDAKALTKDRSIRPRPPLNHRGEVQWVTSEAKYYLEIDVENNQHVTMDPEPFYKSRPVYERDCPRPDVFRGHVHQEVKTQKWRKQWVDGKKEYPLVSGPTEP